MTILCFDYFTFWRLYVLTTLRFVYFMFMPFKILHCVEQFLCWAILMLSNSHVEQFSCWAILMLSRVEQSSVWVEHSWFCGYCGVYANIVDFMLMRFSINSTTSWPMRSLEKSSTDPHTHTQLWSTDSGRVKMPGYNTSHQIIVISNNPAGWKLQAFLVTKFSLL